MSKLTQAFQRLSPRERLMVTGLGGVVIFALIFTIYSWLQGKITTLEANIAEEQSALQTIYASTDSYLAAKAQVLAMEEQGRASATINLPTVITNLADRMPFEGMDRRRNPTGTLQLSDQLEFKSTKEKNVGIRAARRTGNQPIPAGYAQVDQEITVKEGVPFDTLYAFLQRIESSKDLLFVTDLRIDRSSFDPERANQGKIVVSTFIYKAAGQE